MTLDDLVQQWLSRGESLRLDPVSTENRAMGDGLVIAAEELGDWIKVHQGETV